MKYTISNDKLASSKRRASKDRERTDERFSFTIWLSAREAARKLTTSHDTINRRGVPWREARVPYRIRWKYLLLDEGGEPEKRYYEPDVEAMLIEPDQLPRASRLKLVPRFIRTKLGKGASAASRSR